MYISIKAAGVALLVASQVAAAPLTQPRAGQSQLRARMNWLGIGPAVYPDSPFKQRGRGKRDEEATAQLQARRIPVMGLGPAEPSKFEPVNPESGDIQPVGRSHHGSKPKPKSGDLPPGSNPSRVDKGVGPAKGVKARPVILPRVAPADAKPSKPLHGAGGSKHAKGSPARHQGEQTVETPAPAPGSKIDPAMIAASPIPVRKGGKPITLSRRDVAAEEEEAEEEATELQARRLKADPAAMIEASYIPVKHGKHPRPILPRSDSPAEEEATELQARGSKPDPAAMIEARYIPAKHGKHSDLILPRSDVPATEEEADDESAEYAE